MSEIRQRRKCENMQFWLKYYGVLLLVLETKQFWQILDYFMPSQCHMQRCFELNDLEWVIQIIMMKRVAQNVSCWFAFSSDIYRFSLETGQFQAPLATDAT